MKQFVHILSSLLIGGLLVSCGKGSNQTTTYSSRTQIVEAKIVEAAIAEKRTIRPLQRYTSTVEAKVSNNIAPQISSRIKRIYVEVGQKVARGQLLAEMDHNQLDQMRLQLQEQQANFTRIDQLYKIGGVSQAEWEAVQRSLQATKSSYANLQENTQLRSPINGVVTARNYDAGDMISMQQPLLVVEQTTPVVLRINPSELYYNMIKEGMPVHIISDALEGETFEGKVSLKHPTIDPRTHTFTIEVEYPNRDQRLVPGLYAEVEIESPEQELLMVPALAVVKQVGSPEQYVFVIKNGVANRKVVNVGPSSTDGYVAILSGVSERDSVVTLGAPLLSDQTPVIVK